MLKWVCFKVWIVHELDCITNIIEEIVCLVGYVPELEAY
jgi:hypothetical protein